MNLVLDSARMDVPTAIPNGDPRPTWLDVYCCSRTGRVIGADIRQQPERLPVSAIARRLRDEGR